MTDAPAPAGARPSGTAARLFGQLAKLLSYLYAVIGVIAVWWAVVLIAKPHMSLLPSPLLTARTFVQLMASGELPSDAAYSICRVLAAWSLAALVAVPLGFAMGRWQRLERVLDPVVELFRPISPLAWIPLAILWFGIDEGGKIFVIFIGTFFPILLNTIAGAKTIDPVLIRAGRILGCADDASLFRKVVLPAALPQVIVGLRISFGTGWAAIIAAELVAARSGLGYLISNGMEVLRSDYVLVGMVTIGVIGVLFDTVFRIIDRRYNWMGE
ncbi:MAG TPA: ABC transporter permease [Pseudolabrys sp.]|jgi:ABC-type nitrate/sulfonate/bicarbonate transport system permease component|nr:ABC transporter permease [Pseudolabrys sp.]